MSRSITEYSQRQKRVTLADWAMSDAGSRRLLKVEVATESIEVQALRLKLQLFASQQTDQTIRRQCHAVDKKLAEVIEGNHPTLRQVLANFS
jgi:hypothetical protein